MNGIGTPVTRWEISPTLARINSVFSPLSEWIVTALVSRPVLPARFRIASSLPSLPGWRIQGEDGNLATVQPHEVVTPSITTTLVEIFVTLKVNIASVSFVFAVYSFSIES